MVIQFVWTKLYPSRMKGGGRKRKKLEGVEREEKEVCGDRRGLEL